MANNIWQQCRGTEQRTTLSVKPWAVVEAQHINSTRHLVDSNEEHQVLKKMIEGIKPMIDEHSYQNFHYLLFTPFRYPPLKHGSRFGQTFEPSLWYGSLELKTAFAETAYYRYLFLHGTTAALGMITSYYNGFQVNVHTDDGIDLTISCFDKHRNEISSKSNYASSQQLGSNMREAGVDAFVYYSARDPGVAKNIGLFSTKAFAQKKPQQQSWQVWLCNADKNHVEFKDVRSVDSEMICFDLSDFLVEGVLPQPAT